MIKPDIKKMLDHFRKHAAAFRELKLTDASWLKEFGKDQKIKTPIGLIKLGEHQKEKLTEKKRTGYFGLIKPTLENPDFVYLDRRGGTVFVKAFKNSKKELWWVSISFLIEGLQIVVSSYEKKENTIEKDVAAGALIYITTSALKPVTADSLNQAPLTGKSSNSNKHKNPVSKNQTGAKMFEKFMHYQPDKEGSFEIPTEGAFIGFANRVDYWSDKMIFDSDKKKNEKILRNYFHHFVKEAPMFLSADGKIILIKCTKAATKWGIVQ